MSETICQKCGEINGGSRSTCMLCGGKTYSDEYSQDSKEDLVYIDHEFDEREESREEREERLDREDRD